MSESPVRPVALQRCDRFVARTMNWMYDHFRRLTRHRPVVLADSIENRDEFPDVEAIPAAVRSVPARVWRRLVPGRMYPPELRRLSAYHPAVLHSHFGYVAAGDFILQAALGIPWLVGFYGADVYLLGHQPEWRERYARLFDRTSLVLALGPVMADALVELGCPRDRVDVHPLGVDPADVPHRPRMLRRGDELQILFAGTFREKKGIVYLVEAAQLLAERGVRFRLHVVGEAGGRPSDAPYRDLVLRGLAHPSLEGRVEQLSWLKFRDLIELGLRCHVFAAPSVTAADGDAEGTPFVIQQMALSGMPVVSTRHSDIPYLYGPHAEWLVPERDPVALADRLQMYAEDPDLIPAHGSLLRDRMVEAFDVRRCADRLSDVYRRATG